LLIHDIKLINHDKLGETAQSEAEGHLRKEEGRKLMTSLSTLPATGESFVLGLYAQALIEAYCAQGGTLEVLANALDVSQTWLCQPPEKLSVDNYLQLMSAAQSITNDHHFGLHVGQHMHSSSFDVLGQAMLQAGNLGQATEQVLALEGLVHTLGNSHILQEPGYIRFVWRCNFQQHPLARELTESVLAGIINFSQRLAGRPMPVMEVTFMHPDPRLASMAEYQRICRSRCHFSQPYNSILVADEVLAWPVDLAVQHTQSLFTPQTASAPRSPASSAPLAHQINHHLASVLAYGNPSLTDIARQYHMTPRTLQRRLEKEGTNFQALLNSVRAGLAEDYLKYSTMSAFQISQMLGFKEQSSFNHFFVETFGLSPSHYRQRHKQKKP